MWSRIFFIFNFLLHHVKKNAVHLFSYLVKWNQNSVKSCFSLLIPLLLYKNRTINFLHYYLLLVAKLRVFSARFTVSVIISKATSPFPFPLPLPLSLAFSGRRVLQLSRPPAVSSCNSERQVLPLPYKPSPNVVFCFFLHIILWLQNFLVIGYITLVYCSFLYIALDNSRS